MFKYLALFAIAIFTLACTHRNNKPIIKFSVDSTAIVIKKFDNPTLIRIKDTYGNYSNHNMLLSVWLLPGESDSLQDQLPIAGTLQLKGDSLLFKPEIPFQKGKEYLAESFIHSQFATTEKLISGDINQNLQPQKQILKR